jgi:lipopolysaccharide transport system permease protein
MGLAWALVTPVLLLAVYTFVFSVVFKVRWQDANESRTEFGMVLFAGLMIFNVFAECVNRAPILIPTHANYVKKVIFPLEILPWIDLGSALFHGLASLTAWIVAHCMLFGLPPATALLFPFVVVPLCFLTVGLSWFLSALGVYLRDISQLVGIVTTVLMFLSPIFYPVSALPAEYRVFLHLNPLLPAIEYTRNVLFWGVLPDPGGFGCYVLTTLILAWAGFAWFQKTRKGFADVL